MMLNLYLPFSDSELLIGPQGLFMNESYFLPKIDSMTDFQIMIGSIRVHFLFYLDLRELPIEGTIVPLNDLGLLHEIEQHCISRFLGWALQEAKKLPFFPSIDEEGFKREMISTDGKDRCSETVYCRGTREINPRKMGVWKGSHWKGGYEKSYGKMGYWRGDYEKSYWGGDYRKGDYEKNYRKEDYEKNYRKEDYEKSYEKKARRWELTKPIYSFQQITYEELLGIKHAHRVGILIFRRKSPHIENQDPEFLFGFKEENGRGLTDFGGGARSYERPLNTIHREFKEEFGLPLSSFPELNLEKASIYRLHNAEGIYIEFFCEVNDFTPFYKAFYSTSEIKGLIAKDSLDDYDILDGSLRYVLRGLGVVS